MPRFPRALLLVMGVGALALAPSLMAQATERVLYVSALDAKTRAPVDTLAPGDLRVTEDGVTREVLRVTPATTPMPVAVIVDNQAAAQPTIADLRSALTAFLAAIDGLGPVALVTIADRPTILQDYTTDAGQLKDAANRVFAMPDSGATLLDALVEVSRGLSKRESDRAAIVVVTPELTEFSTLHFSQVLDGLKASGAMMSAVVLQNLRGPIQADAARNRAVVLDRGVKETGGWREDVLTSMSYRQALERIAAALKRQYRVVYARPQTLIPPERVQVTAARDGLVMTGAPARGQKDR
ncbi:MAG: hypothetical protein IT177_02270 [Acidobacteria bacterium]|nr:hypothetical protein [Acidobacteriota bacterium]